MQTQKYAFDMDFETEVVYFRTGTPEVDGEGPSAFQGLTLVEFRRFTKSKQWAFMCYDAKGDPYPGYMAQELSQGGYELWKSRIDGAAASPVIGYADSGGLWFPGNLPGSVISEQAHAARMILLEDSFYARDADRIIEAELGEVLKQRQLDALKAEFGISSKIAGRSAMEEDIPQVLSRVGELRERTLGRAAKKELFNSILSAIRGMRSSD